MTDALLEPEQEELLVELVEASRKVPRERRQPFYGLLSGQDYDLHIQHPGFPGGEGSGYSRDIEVLGDAGLLMLTQLHGGTWQFTVSPEGFARYSRNKQRVSDPVERVQTAVRDYLSADQFRERYPKAFRKWSEAETMLWDSDSVEKLTTIGHLCREATQAFADVLVDRHLPGESIADKAKTVARVKAVLDLREDQLGSTEKSWLDALLVYWRRVSDLIQRQEHGAQREGGALAWEDGRRVVFQTAIVMFEIDRSLSRT